MPSVRHPVALGLHVAFLLIGIGVALWAMLLLRAAASTGIAVDLLGIARLPVDTTAEPWLAFAAAGAGGHLLASLRGTVIHGFGHRDFDRAAIAFHWLLMPLGAFGAVALMALGEAVIPGAEATDLLRPWVLAVAALAGFFSEDTLEALRRRFLSLLGREAGARARLGPDLVPDLPLDQVLGHLPEGLGIDRLQRVGITGSRDLWNATHQDKRRRRLEVRLGLQEGALAGVPARLHSPKGEGRAL